MARDNSLERGFSKLGYTLGALPYLREQIALKNEAARAGIDSAYALQDERDATTALKHQQLDEILELEAAISGLPQGGRLNVNQMLRPSSLNPQQATAAYQNEQSLNRQDRLLPPGTGAYSPEEKSIAMALEKASPEFSDSGGRVLGRYTGDLDEGSQQAQAAIEALGALTGQRDSAADLNDARRLHPERFRSAGSAAASNFTRKQVEASYERDYPKDKNGKSRVNLREPGQPIPSREQYAAWFGVDLGFEGPDLAAPAAEDEEGLPFMDRVFNALGLGPNDDEPAAAEDLPDLGGGEDDPAYQEALDAIEAGADPAAVNARLRAMGLNPLP